MQNMRELMRWEADITAFVGRFTGGGVHLPEAVLAYFDVPNAQLCVKVQKEILLACEPTKTSVPARMEGARLLLPSAAVEKLHASDGDFVAMIERRNAFAFKRIPRAVLEAFDGEPAAAGNCTIQIRPLVKAQARPKPRKAKAETPTAVCRPGAVPQVVAVEPLRNGNRINLRKGARSHLPAGGSVGWECGDEVVLTRGDTGCAAEMKGVGLLLPAAVLAKLALSQPDRVALIERPHGLALKKLTIEVRGGAKARAYDRETAAAVTRVLETNPEPETLLPTLASRHRSTSLRHDVREWLRGRETFHAWFCREMLGLGEDGDGQLRQRLAGERLAAQRGDGSWEGEPMATARCLRELFELGAADSPDVRRGAEWLLARAESAANPGMFFLSDRLVARQAEILEKRKRSKSLGSLRFAGGTPSEKRRVNSADDLIPRPCGTRIMTPNALVLEPLLALGYESHPRVQRCLESLLHGYTYWCECNYQLRAGTHSYRPVPTDEDLDRRECDCRDHFRYGGFRGPEGALEATRERAATAAGENVYELRMNHHLQRCEVFTTKALRYVQDPIARRAATVHLWRFAGVQHGADGSFEGYPECQVHMLQVFSCHDHPASRVAIMRSVPWLVGNQNPDGSWGEESRRDACTHAVLSACLRVRDVLPGFFGWEV